MKSTFTSKKQLFLLFVAFFYFHYGNCQSVETYSSTAKNSVYVELFGHGFIYSINYDRLLGLKNKLGYGFRVGFGGDYPLNNTIELFDDGFSSIPFSWYFLYGKQRHFIDLDFSVIPSFGGDVGKKVDFGLGLAYRLQPPKGGVFFTAGAIFQTFNVLDGGSYALPKIGFGYTFDKNISPARRSSGSKENKKESEERSNRPKNNFAHIQFLKRDSPLETIVLYERLLLNQGLFSLTAAIGFGAGRAVCRTTYVPLELTILFGKVAYLEFTGNSMYVLKDSEFCSHDWSFTRGFRYGIRFQPPDKKIIFRLGAAHLPNVAIDNLKAHLSLSVGLAF